MKFAHLRLEGESTTRLAAVIDEKALFLDEVMDEAPRGLQELIEGGDAAFAAVRAHVDHAVANRTTLTPVAELRHSSAVLHPPVVLAIGANYAAHASELKLRSETAMTVFSLWPNSLTGHGSTTSWPGDIAREVDYEAELGVIIGHPAKDVSAEDALSHVWGYTVVNDITARDIQYSEAQWSRCKSFDGFTPTGPFVVTADEVPDPQDLHIWTIVDGHQMQDASTAQMVRPVATLVSHLSRSSTLLPGTLISHLSRSATLLPGTLISTGSPGGAGYSRDPQVFLRDRSTVTVGIDGIGALTTHCRILG